MSKNKEIYHSHTCECGYTWAHGHKCAGVDSAHICVKCGKSQFFKDETNPENINELQHCKAPFSEGHSSVRILQPYKLPDANWTDF